MPAKIADLPVYISLTLTIFKNIDDLYRLAGQRRTGISMCSMTGTLIAAVAGLIGVLLGGGVRAWEASRARKLEAASLLSALVAEIEALTRLINHRNYVGAIDQTRAHAQALVDEGRPEQNIPFLTVSLEENYFEIFEAAASRVGLLHPYHADRITRFYMYVKAVKENYSRNSPFSNGADAASVVQICLNDLMLLQTILVLGNHIAGFRTIAAPPNTPDPFDPIDQSKLAEPALPSGEHEAKTPPGG